jgi:hypothetical protein
MKPRLQPILIELQPSKLLLGLLCAISIVACVILAQLPFSILIKCVLIILVLVSSAYFIWRDALLRLPTAWKSLEVTAQGVLKLTNNRGEIFEPILAASTVVHALVTILNFKHGFNLRRMPPVIIFTSQVNQEGLRKLRVWLRWWQHQEEVLSEA